MKRLITLTLLIAATSVFAATDYQCVNDCTAKGYMYNLCTDRCSFDESYKSNSNNNAIKQTDYQCVNDCTAKGYQYNYCSNICSF